MNAIGAFFLLFLAVPLVEIYLLIRVGSTIGAAWTILLVVGTAVLGAVLVRAQGFATLNRMRAQLDAGEVPARELLEGVFLLVAGALLLTPGFVTDAVGFVFLTPPVRRHLIHYVAKRVIRSGGPGPGAGSGPGPTRSGPRRPPIDGDFERLD